ncbi:hypothetical protein KQI84_10125 [bacterium]|nr:hypothetical protein [bacterium]
MSDEPQDQLPAERESWDAVLHRAGERTLAEGRAASRPGGSGKRPWAFWLRIAVPVLILGVYVTYKAAGWDFSSRRSPKLEEVDSLTGVERQQDELPPLDKPTRDLVGRLEALLAAKDWPAIRKAVAEAPKAAQERPEVEAFDLIAQVESGQSNPSLNKRIVDLEPYFSRKKSQEPMLNYLRLMRAEMLFRSSSNDPQALIRNMDEFRRLVADQPLTERVLLLRLKLAGRYELMGARVQEEAGGVLRRDVLELTTARSLYQQGLRWVTTREGWMKLQPISPGKAAASIDRLITRMRSVNGQLHGPALPWENKDPETWTGKKGDPIHDYPGGTW